MEYRDIREQVIEYSLLSQKNGLIKGTSGNISVRSEDSKVVAITPTSIPYELLTPEDIPLVDLDGNVVDGDKKPSSEVLMHTIVLKNRPDLNAVVHTHSLYATVMSIIGKDIPAMTIPQLGMGMVPFTIAPFELPGSRELGEIVSKTLGERGVACMMEHHGLLAAGKSIDKAFAAAEYAEEAAQVAYYTHLAGAMNGISAEAIQKMIEIAKSGRAL